MQSNEGRWALLYRFQKNVFDLGNGRSLVVYVASCRTALWSDTSRYGGVRRSEKQEEGRTDPMHSAIPYGHRSTILKQGLSLPSVLHRITRVCNKASDSDSDYTIQSKAREPARTHTLWRLCGSVRAYLSTCTLVCLQAGLCAAVWAFVSLCAAREPSQRHGSVWEDKS